MSNATWFFDAPLKSAIGWTIFHSLWQLSLIALIIYLILRFIPRKKAEFRYSLLLIGMLVGLVCTGITFFQEWKPERSAANIMVNARPDTPAAIPNALPAGEPTPSLWDQFDILGQKLDAHIPVITFFWLSGLLLFSAYLLFGLLYLKYLEHRRSSLPSDQWLIRLEALQLQMGVKSPVRLFISDAVHEPITFQLFRPVIMVPVFFFTGLTPAQIEVLLLHELAHIRRYDFTINLLQSLVEIIFFFHPAIWWLSGRIREEREYCCDNAVLAVRQDPFPYVEALTRIQSTHFNHKNRLAMSANGKNSILSKRVFRLFGRYEREPSRYKSVLIALLLLAVSFSAQAFWVEETAPVQIESLPILAVVEDQEATPEPIEPIVPETVRENSPLPATTPAVAINPEPTRSETVRDTLPLYVIDGVKKGSSNSLNDLKPDQIKSISVLKGDKAVEKYGEAGQYGVIEISTKQADASEEGNENAKPETPASPQGTIRIRAKTEVSNTTVKGTVTDENDKPLIGVNILIKGTRTGTITDFTGEFQLEIPDDCVTLVFAYVGKETTELENVCAGEEKVLVKLGASETSGSGVIRKNERNAAPPTGTIISGRILNEDQAPMIGASIIIKGTTVGTISDMQGDFRLRLDSDCATLVISYVGMKPKMLENICEGKDLQIILVQKTANTVSPTVTPNTNATPSAEDLVQPETVNLKVFPNPAQGAVNISFQTEQEARVKLSVYTLDGKLVKTLVDQKLNAGPHQFKWESGPEMKGTFPILLEIGDKIARKQVVIE
ncbi:M56 family metallopeptidase [Flavilitoribacter nigricans]|uniref:Peptidase M56 domain-containing protein n=1 Tax=Flavilitoribacter nigricans (strain ATCC 23147 / DSM 23189 / NBRC 102662 / NCIMB 1420 / SS-2) TaxID=1122177 RepID=A0A2D0NG01_FLAN2|nr:M56 family metallopeptidase [Flavilitoribacter nigricans]PHN07306.1 hypothetical protein CRP01_06660 [Flavilitoribacter nigricans DSM 23189 = NBRC 102662]